ncbi:MAG: histidinol-phosphate aminotransferase family protein [Bacteroidia bacterium]|nr:histidinol-phosphate aminotransferase family protein [Bacteroidia bacterium]
MNTIDRRNWLRTVGLGGGFTLLGGLPALADTAIPRHISSTGPIKLSSNENPYGPSSRVREVIKQNFDNACRYPFSFLRGLVDMIAEKEGVSKDHVVVTGGSTEGLKACGLVFGLNDKEVVAADPTFQALLRYAENFGSKVHRVPLNETMHHDLEAMGNKINGNTGLVFICNPNNPTGTLLDSNDLIDFCNTYEKDTVIFSDEAYYDFIMEPDYPSMITLVKKGKNVVVSKTFSKVYGLAGLRIGYLIARPDIATRLKNAIMAMSNVLAIEAAKEALRDDEFYTYSLLQNTKAKKLIYSTLEELDLPYIKSHTNFIFFRSGRSIHELIPAMRDEGVLIGRPFPPKLDWARISTGTLEETELFNRALTKILG